MYDKIYTVGCFDWFHHGHKKLLADMRKIWKTINIGIHDDNNIEKIKNLKPHEHQPLKTRMENIKKCDSFITPVSI